MIRLTILLTFLCATLTMDAQNLKVPELSPLCKMEQNVGLSTIKIQYSRPSVKGREIFGKMLPYGELWRTGANSNTTITFDNDLKINNQDVKKGAYAIFTIPGKEQWDVIIYNDPFGFTPQQLDPEKVIIRFKTLPILNPNFIETFTIDFADIKTSSAKLQIKWVNKIISIPVGVPGDEMAMENIKMLMDGPSADDVFQAAEYYFFNDKDLDQALVWAQMSEEKYNWDAYWPSYLQARILAKLKRYDEAIVAGQRASKYVHKVGYTVVGDQIDEKLKEWKKL